MAAPQGLSLTRYTAYGSVCPAKLSVAILTGRPGDSIAAQAGHQIDGFQIAPDFAYDACIFFFLRFDKSNGILKSFLRGFPGFESIFDALLLSPFNLLET